ncbi:alpha/beta-Hydrolases superfamily protein [Perilla frutescens var. hirtella]|nr:alpha/beta-Hydrolases superfamily protein [Perilla frutescens var. frutescens]KAH6784445.1 alpha/beta-Hydrolases superfamily protein [Perilla frutescens var. hirtella]
MAKCFSFTTSRDQCYRWSFSSAGLRSTTVDIGGGTVIHYWGPKTHKPGKPTLLLLHGIGANAMWQWNDFVSPLTAKFNVYVPDLLFFGDSYTKRPERGESFQAECVMKAMEAAGVRRMSVVGLSYGGFVAYSMAAQFPEAVERVVIGCAGVCLEEKDMDDGLFKVKSVDEAIEILLAQTPAKLRELMRLSFYKPAKNVPSCFLSDFIDVMCTENLQERKELIYALHKDRKLSDLPKITQPTLIIWGEHDQVFPLELAHRLVRVGSDDRHLENNVQLVVLKKAGHAINMEKTKELYKNLKSFLNVPANPKLDSNGNGCKVD